MARCLDKRVLIAANIPFLLSDILSPVDHTGDHQFSF